MKVRSIHSLPVAVVHHGLPGGEQGLLSLLGLGPLGVQQTVHSLGGCRTERAEERLVVTIQIRHRIREQRTHSNMHI